MPEAPEIDLIRPFYDHPGFIDAFVDHTRQALERIPEELRPETRLLYSAHSCRSRWRRSQAIPAATTGR